MCAMSLLQDLVKLIKSEPDHWTESFIRLGGFQELLETLADTLEPHQGEETSADRLQSEILRTIRVLIAKPSGMRYLLLSSYSLDVLSQVLLADNVRSKTQLFFLLATVCHFSEDGFSFGLNVLNAVKNIKKEEQLFFAIVQSLLEHPQFDECWTIYKISVMMFINTLLNPPTVKSTKEQIRKEVQDAGLLTVVNQLLNQDIDSTLDIQLRITVKEFENSDEDEEGDVDGSEMVGVQLPVTITKLIYAQLSGSKAQDYFVNMLQFDYFWRILW